MGELVTTDHILLRSKTLLDAVPRVVINSVESMEKGADFSKQLKSLSKLAEEQRKRLVAPLNATLDEINAEYKNIKTPLDNAAKLVESKMLEFTLEQRRIAQEEENTRRKAAEEAAEIERLNRESLALMNIKQDDIDALINVLPTVVEVTAVAVPQITRGFISTAGTKKTWKFTVEDIVALANSRPDLILVDEVKVRQCIRDGEREIEGLNIFQEESMSER